MFASDDGLSYVIESLVPAADTAYAIFQGRGRVAIYALAMCRVHDYSQERVIEPVVWDQERGRLTLARFVTGFLGVGSYVQDVAARDGNLTITRGLR